MTELINAKDLSKAIGLSPSTIHRYALTGGMPFVALPRGRRMFLREAVEKWISDRLTVITPSEPEPGPTTISTALAPAPTAAALTAKDRRAALRRLIPD